MVKRKALRDTALKNNNTPSESFGDIEFSKEFMSREKLQRKANRNSKKGFQGKENK